MWYIGFTRKYISTADFISRFFFILIIAICILYTCVLLYIIISTTDKSMNWTKMYIYNLLKTYLFVSYLFSQRWDGALKSYLLDENEPVILQSPYYSCPQSKSSRGIDLIIPEWYGLNTRGLFYLHGLTLIPTWISHNQTSTAPLLKLGNGRVISSHTL